jgi:hypothetical protein
MNREFEEQQYRARELTRLVLEEQRYERMARFIFPGVVGDPIQQKPGIYQNVPFETYLSWNAASNSSLGRAVVEISPLIISMAHYKKQLPFKQSDAMRFGTMCHSSKFEFANALRDYVAMPDFRNYREADDGTLIEDPCCNKGKMVKAKDGTEKYERGAVSKTPASTEEYSERVAAFEKKHIGKIIVTDEAMNKLAGVLNALDQNQTVRRLYANNGPVTESRDAGTEYEVSIVWIDEQTGLLCKGRIDCAQHGTRELPDLKTSASVASFDKAVGHLGYHRQGAFYSDGMRTLTGSAYRPWCVAAEPDGPVFGVRAKPIGEATLAAGRHQYRLVLDRIRIGVETNKWPEFEEIGQAEEGWEIPHWMLPMV